MLASLWDFLYVLTLFHCLFPPFRVQLDKRREAIDRANKLLAEDSDRVKSFYSALQFADVLAEREAQLRLKDELNKLEKVREERYHYLGKHNYRQVCVMGTCSRI